MRAWWGRAGESSRCEDPAPTVGVCGDGIAIQMPAIAASMPHMEPLILYNDAARRVATLFESLNCLIKTFLP